MYYIKQILQLNHLLHTSIHFLHLLPSSPPLPPLYTSATPSLPPTSEVPSHAPFIPILAFHCLMSHMPPDHAAKKRCRASSSPLPSGHGGNSRQFAPHPLSHASFYVFYVSFRIF